MNIEVPPIYEEDIIEFAQRNGNVIFKYYDNGRIIEIVFNCAYEFDFIEFDYINEAGWKFGLELQSNSMYIEKIIQNISKEKLQRIFGGEYKKIQHYKLVINDVGMYNIICKDINIKLGSS